MKIEGNNELHQFQALFLSSLVSLFIFSSISIDVINEIHCRRPQTFLTIVINIHDLIESVNIVYTLCNNNLLYIECRGC